MTDPAKDYFRFDPAKTLGLVTSTQGNTLYLSDDEEKLVVAPALEAVNLWNMRIGEIVGVWSDPENKSIVTCIIKCTQHIFAVGYEDGSIRLWDQRSHSLIITLSGHKSAVTVLCYDDHSGKLASGSKDCDIVIWDVSTESGLYRLRGHNNVISALSFLRQGQVLVSASKDTLIKIWDLETQHCADTFIAHRTEIIAMASYQHCIFTIGSDKLLRAISINLAKFDELLRPTSESIPSLLPPAPSMVANPLVEENAGQESSGVFSLLEAIDRSTKERAMSLSFKSGYMAITAVDKTLEIYKINTALLNNSDDGEKDFVAKEQEQPGEKSSGRRKKTKLFTLVQSLKLWSKARSVVFSPHWNIRKHQSIRLLLGFNANSIQEMIIPFEAGKEVQTITSLDYLGHRSDIRCVAISGDGKMALSASEELVKIWNIETEKCIRVIETANVVSAIFTLGDLQVVLGLQDGILEYHNLLNGEVLDSIQAHQGAIWSIALRPDQKGFMTGSADKSVKFWEFKNKKKQKDGNELCLKHIKSLQIGEEVLCVKYSPDKRLIAIALLDMTVKIFYEDSLKFFLSLYGHKLPVTSMSISPDSSVIATGSADKSIKVWSLQFGDCRRSLFAHTDTVTTVQFCQDEPGRKLLISAGKDGIIKYWDMESYEQLQKLEGHHGTIWSLAYNKRMIVSGSQDRSLRIWKQSEEILFPSEETEKEIDAQIDQSLLEENQFEKDAMNKEEVGMATKKTLAAMKAGERLVEALEAADIERKKEEVRDLALKEHGKVLPVQSKEVLFLVAGGDKTPAELVLWAFEQIPLVELEQALLSIPISKLPSILCYVRIWFDNRLSLSMSSRVLTHLIKVWYNYIVADSAMYPLLMAIRDVQRAQMEEFKEVLELNMGTIKFHNLTRA